MIAVTGATGLLGNTLVRKLIEAGEPFVAFKRNNSNTSLLGDVGDKIVWRNADLLDPVSLDEGLQGVTKIIHSAGLVSFSPRDKKKLYDTNVLGTRYLINASLHHNIRRFIHISSVAALSRPKDIEQLDETQKWVESPLNTVYGESKYLSEVEVMRGFEEGLSVAIINPSVILGPGDWNKSSAKFFRYVWKGNSFYTDGNVNYVDVNDVASAALHLLQSSHNGERFVISAGSMSYKLFFEHIAKYFNKRPPSLKVNKNVLGILGTLESFRSMLTGASPLITRETARIAKTRITYSNEKIRNKLNFKFQSIDDTLKQCCEYYIEQVNHKK
jgi:nucleoside-diphosphate-sugar epimerase